jgi:hypothetical protein
MPANIIGILPYIAGLWVSIHFPVDGDSNRAITMREPPMTGGARGDGDETSKTFAQTRGGGEVRLRQNIF